uniref:GST N-terminal domain-containing protein n=1 Tax=Hyaloperonospora arabidopsidis (strain Emoy2) TaxID=559515 RepID=M4BJ65_HYAAE
MATASSANNLVSSEDAMLQSAPLPHERVVYWGSGSPQAWRTLIALEEKNLPYRSICISFSSGVLKTPFFRALNPRMRIPVLVEPVEHLRQQVDKRAREKVDATTVEVPRNVDETVRSDTPRRMVVNMSQDRTIVYESGAILAYLEKTYDEAPCMPLSPALYAVAQSRLHESNEILSIVGDLVVYLRRFPHEKRNVAVVNAKWASVECELRLWESYLDGHEFLVDPEVPYLCDFTLFTNIAYAVRCGLQLDGLYPRLARFYVRLCARKSIKTTWPPHWRTTFGSKVLTKTCCQCGGGAVQPCTCRQRSPVSPTSAQATQQSS